MSTGSERPLQSLRNRRRRWATALTIVLFVGTVSALLVSYVAGSSQSAREYVGSHGPPAFVASDASLATWNPNSPSLIKAKKVVLAGIRKWEPISEKISSCVLVYSDDSLDSGMLMGYVQMVFAGDISAGGAGTTFALGSRVRLTLVFVGGDGNIARIRRYEAPFVTVRTP